MEPQLVDVGPVLFDRASEREVSIHNKGKVQFPFEVDTSALSRPSVCDVSPKTGVVSPGQHAVLKLKVYYLSSPLSISRHYRNTEKYTLSLWKHGKYRHDAKPY